MKRSKDSARAESAPCKPGNPIRGRTGVASSRCGWRTEGWIAAALKGLLAATLALLAAQPAHAADAVDDEYLAPSGQVLSVEAPGLLENDCCPSRDSVSASLEVAPSHGQVTVNSDGSFTYQNDGLGATSDSFQYRATDSTGSDVATVFLTVFSVGTPEAQEDDYSVAPGGTLSVPPPGVLGNDTDPDGDPLTAIVVDPPSFASSFSLNGDGSFTYVHDETLSEPGSFDTFRYFATDGESDSEAVPVSIEISSDPSSGPAVVLTFGFDEVSGVELRSQLGTTNEEGGGKIKREQIDIEAGSVLASASGPGMPSQTLALQIRSLDELLAAAARDQFESCQKAALIAQARPDLYHLELVLELPPEGVLQASQESVVIEMIEGHVTCSVRRGP